MTQRITVVTVPSERQFRQEQTCAWPSAEGMATSVAGSTGTQAPSTATSGRPVPGS